MAWKMTEAVDVIFRNAALVFGPAVALRINPKTAMFLGQAIYVLGPLHLGSAKLLRPARTFHKLVVHPLD
jgi:hypothetical protein